MDFFVAGIVGKLIDARMDGSNHLACPVLMEINNHRVIDCITPYFSLESSHDSFPLGVNLHKFADEG